MSDDIDDTCCHTIKGLFMQKESKEEQNFLKQCLFAESRVSADILNMSLHLEKFCSKKQEF
jgi:hypothetical protein